MLNRNRNHQLFKTWWRYYQTLMSARWSTSPKCSSVTNRRCRATTPVNSAQWPAGVTTWISPSWENLSVPSFVCCHQNTKMVQIKANIIYSFFCNSSEIYHLFSSTGLSTMRATAVSGRPLPSARMVSANIHNDVSAPHTRYSLMVMQYAQLLDHDLTFTPVNRGFGGSIIDCNSCDSAKTVHPECAPIPIPPNDPWFPHIDRATGRPKCIPFTRSLPGQLTLGNIHLFYQYWGVLFY